MRDKQATKERCFSDPRSRVEDGHEYLAGRDRQQRRLAVFLRDGHRCVKCGEMTTWQGGEMDHIEGGLGKQRSDDLSNLQWVCGIGGCGFHQKKHVHIMSGGK